MDMYTVYIYNDWEHFKEGNAVAINYESLDAALEFTRHCLEQDLVVTIETDREKKEVV